MSGVSKVFLREINISAKTHTLIKSDSKDIYNVINDFCFKLILFYTIIFSRITEQHIIM